MFDLHNSLGFYFSPVITLIALTGVVITFSRYAVIAIFIAGLTPPKSLESILGQKSTYQEKEPLTVTEIVAMGNAEIEGGKVMGISLPHDSVGTYNVNIMAPGRAKTGDRTMIHYDQYSGERLMSTHHDFVNTGKIFLNWVTPIHYGTFGGPVTRVLALVACLVAASLLITGFLIWYWRWKKLTAKSKAKEDKEHVTHVTNTINA